jgi:hypothetical protein
MIHRYCENSAHVHPKIHPARRSSQLFFHPDMFKLVVAAAVAATAISGAQAAAVIYSNVGCPAGNAAPANPADLVTSVVQTAPTDTCFQVDTAAWAKADCQTTPGKAVVSVFKDAGCTQLSQTMGSLPADGTCGTFSVSGQHVSKSNSHSNMFDSPKFTRPYPSHFLFSQGDHAAIYVNCAAPGALPAFVANSQYMVAPAFATTCPITGSLIGTSLNILAFPLASPLTCPPATNQSPFSYVTRPI